MNSDPILFLLDAGGQNFLNLEGCNSAVAELLAKIKQELEKTGLVPDFVRYLQHTEETRIIGSEYDGDLPVFFNFISRNYSNWFGLPISTPQQCIGYFVLTSPSPQERQRVGGMNHGGHYGRNRDWSRHRRVWGVVRISFQ